MRDNTLNKEQIKNIAPKDVHNILNRTMMVDGFPMVIDLKKSQGMYLYDSRENRHYLDMFSFFASWALGHSHAKMNTKEFRERISETALHNPSNSDIYTVEMAQFVATFERIAMPDEFRHLFFIAGGGLAVENAFKTAFDWKVRNNIAAGKGEKGHKIIYFKDAFHGRTGYTLTTTDTFNKNKVKHFAKFDWYQVENPKIRFPLEGGNHIEVEAAEKRALSQIEKILDDDGDDVAAIVIEPIQGEGGDNHFRGEFLRELRRISDKYNVLLIFDEIQSGVGLTGKMWAYQHFNLVPDILAFGKKTQVCGIMVTDRVDSIDNNVFKVSSRLNSTWGGNLTDMVRAQRILEIIEEDKLVENAAAVGEYLLQKLLEMGETFPRLLSNIRGRGLMCALDLPTIDQRDQLRNMLFEKGMIILPCGAKTIRFRPALICQKDDIDRACALLYDALKTM